MLGHEGKTPKITQWAAELGDSGGDKQLTCAASYQIQFSIHPISGKSSTLFLSPSSKSHALITRRFNPIASTIMLKALTTLLTKHSSTSKSIKSAKLNKDTIKFIVESSHGDIRSAVMAMQFACIANLSKGNKSGNMRSVYVL